MTGILLVIVLLYAASTHAAFSVKQVLNLRLENLKKFASVPQYPSVPCSSTKFALITEYQYGNTGNHIIEFVHGLWMARRMNATLIVPAWMQDIFVPFDQSILKKQFCYTLNPDVPKGAPKPIEITSEESFFLPKLWHDNNFIPFLPSDMGSAIPDLSLHFLKVYAALWSSPLPEIFTTGAWIIERHLDSNLRYTSVHKRQMEGGCNKIMAHVTKPSDFSPDEINVNRPEWQGNLAHNHPLCSMPVEMVLETQSLRHRNGSLIYVAYDGAGEVDSYRRHKAVFSSVLDADGVTVTHAKTNRKFIDMFVAIHSDLFILNPRSTFSWQIYLIRVCLALESVPVIRENDVYLAKVPEELVSANRTLWVSMTSVVEAYFEHHRQISRV